MKRATGEGAKRVVTQVTTESTKALAKQAAKQAALQTAKTAIAAGLVIEVVYFEIKSAHNKKKRGEITREQFHDKIVEQTTTSGGSAAGGIGGSLGGAAAGAVLGSAVPVVGTVIGAAIGAVVGNNCTVTLIVVTF